MKNTLSVAAIITAAAIIMLAAVFAGGYFYGSRTASEELENLKGRVNQQAEQAKKTLSKLTKERDEKQAALDAHAKLQEDRDNAAKHEIARLTDELSNRPVRVRVIANTDTGACGGSAAGDTSTDTEAGAGNDASASGLLPESNSRRLRAAIAEVETLSAAYSSCRKRLFSQ